MGDLGSDGLVKGAIEDRKRLCGDSGTCTRFLQQSPVLQLTTSQDKSQIIVLLCWPTCTPPKHGRPQAFSIFCRFTDICRQISGGHSGGREGTVPGTRQRHQPDCSPQCVHTPNIRLQSKLSSMNFNTKYETLTCTTYDTRFNW